MKEEIRYTSRCYISSNFKCPIFIMLYIQFTCSLKQKNESLIQPFKVSPKLLFLSLFPIFNKYAHYCNRIAQRELYSGWWAINPNFLWRYNSAWFTWTKTKISWGIILGNVDNLIIWKSIGTPCIMFLTFLSRYLQVTCNAKSQNFYL